MNTISKSYRSRTTCSSLTHFTHTFTYERGATMNTPSVCVCIKRCQDLCTVCSLKMFCGLSVGQSGDIEIAFNSNYYDEYLAAANR